MATPFYTSMPRMQNEPSFFELIMSDRLNHSALSGCRHILQVLSGRLSHDSRVGSLLLHFVSNFMDEIQTAFICYWQYKSLWHHGKYRLIYYLKFHV
jgi:hypothetical protein